jgi:hypothetical protein
MNKTFQDPQWPLGHPSHSIDPNAPRFIFENGQWVKHEPAKHAVEPNPDYVDCDDKPLWVEFGKKV